VTKNPPRHKCPPVQFSLFDDGPIAIEEQQLHEEIDLSKYKKILIFFSGGKDSVACVLDLLKKGVPPEKIELHHHCVDGELDDRQPFMDWPVTTDYCRKFAEAFGLQIYFSWRMGGFEREMLKENARSAPIRFEDEEHVLHQGGGKNGKITTRRKFPQVAADLRVRWCSAALKIDVGRLLITNQERFADGQPYLVVTGERAEESPGRARYAFFERDFTDNREGKRIDRHVDHLRPVHGWSEAQIWEIIREFGVNPHPCYKAGWGRCSCALCIFGSNNQWATLRKHMSERFEKVAGYEEQFGCTIQRDRSVREMADKGKPYEAARDWIALALSEEYTEPVLVDPDSWEYPAGAFGESNGPV
jgi:3'-phosphoadenosine 5'-phosphosulfate sulfotransferase (PAPS reductase)/FAD synthetase